MTAQERGQDQNDLASFQNLFLWRQESPLSFFFVLANFSVPMMILLLDGGLIEDLGLASIVNILMTCTGLKCRKSKLVYTQKDLSADNHQSDLTFQSIFV